MSENKYDWLAQEDIKELNRMIRVITPLIKYARRVDRDFFTNWCRLKYAADYELKYLLNAVKAAKKEKIKNIDNKEEKINE